MSNQPTRTSFIQWAANKVLDVTGGRTSTPISSPTKSSTNPETTSAMHGDLPSKDRPSSGGSTIMKSNTNQATNEDLLKKNRPSSGRSTNTNAITARNGVLPNNSRTPPSGTTNTNTNANTTRSGDLPSKDRTPPSGSTYTNTNVAIARNGDLPRNDRAPPSSSIYTNVISSDEGPGHLDYQLPLSEYSKPQEGGTATKCPDPPINKSVTTHQIPNPLSEPFSTQHTPTLHKRVGLNPAVPLPHGNSVHDPQTGQASRPLGAVPKNSRRLTARSNAYDCEPTHQDHDISEIMHIPGNVWETGTGRPAIRTNLQQQGFSGTRSNNTAATKYPDQPQGRQESGGVSYTLNRRPTSKSALPPSEAAREVIARISNPLRRGLRSSLEEYQDPESITGKIAEIRNLIQMAKALRNKPEATSQGLALCEQIAERNGKLSSYMVMNGVEGMFRSNCLEFSKENQSLRQAFLNPPIRVRANSVDDNQHSPQASSRPEFPFASDVANQLREGMDESVIMDPKPVSGFHGFTAEDAFQTMIDQLTRRISSHEADSEDQMELINHSVNQLVSDYNGLNEVTESMKHAILKLGRELNQAKGLAKADVDALRNRVECVESIPAAKEWTALRAEVEQLRAQVARGVHPTYTLSPLQLQEVKSAVLKELQNTTNPCNTLVAADLADLKEEMNRTTFKSDSLLFATKQLYTKVKEMEQNSSPPLPAHDGPAVGAAPPDDNLDQTTAPGERAAQPDVGNVIQTIPQVDNTTFLQRKLDLTLEKIVRATQTLPDVKDDLCTFDSVYATTKPSVIKLISLATDTMKDILRITNIPQNEYIHYETTLEDAENWLLNLEDQHQQRPTASTPQNRPNRKVLVFRGEASLNVYEFMDTFNSAYSGITSTRERADILYHDFLSDAIRSQCLTKSDDFLALRRWLIEQFGNLAFILNQMVAALEIIKPPSINDTAARLSFFTAISRFFFRAEKLSRYEGINQSEVSSFMSSLTTMHRMIQILPEKDESDLISQFRAQGISTMQPLGAPALGVYKNFVTARVEDLQRSKDKINLSTLPASRPKQKNAQTVTTDHQQASEPTPTAMTTKPQAQWWTNGLNFPCPMKDHDHEVGMCPEFFFLSPEARREGSNVEGRRMCWCCLRPRTLCKGQCLNAKIPDILRCQGCTEIAKAKGLTPICILFCIQTKHDPNKPAPKDAYAALKKYLKTMPPSVNPDAIVFANFGAWSLATERWKDPVESSKTSAPEPKAKVKIFNTEDGSVLGTEDPSEHLEWGDSCLIMQTIKIGSSSCLVMFDRGANVNLINGDLAENEGLYVLSQQPTRIQGIGAQGVFSEYGRYVVTLGSGKSDYHRMTCHGMPQVTVKFPKYDLKSINDEVAQLSCIPAGTPLPESVGGTQVDLLIGNQDHSLDPVRIGVLPCGLSVFQSPFYDIFGSNICFGGPHPLFAETNRANHFSSVRLAHFTKGITNIQAQMLANPRLYLPTPDILESHTSSKCRLYMTNHHSQGESSHGETSSFACLSTSEVANDPLPCIQRKEIKVPSDGRHHFCSANKAYIPLSKLRETLDEDDLSDAITYRCPECSECITCKRSSRQNALSIQDAAEQLAIEKSVEIDTTNHSVWVDLPFVIDPVPFLTKRHNGSDNYKQALKVYLSQCRKPNHIKEAIRAQHTDLVAQGFITPIESLSSDAQKMIAEAPFRHYFPFRSVLKEDSPSTPVRLVVDPTMTGLNLCLPKGENKIAKIPDILTEARTRPYMWATDIKKMYNQLKVKTSSLQYQLMLFHHSMDPKIAPDVWVLTSAWYGVVNTGNQAGHAVDKLTEIFQEKCPHAVAPLTKQRYVDDIASATQTEALREEQIQQCQWVLAQGGFSLKYIIRSGEVPPEAATTDGQYVKLLGYKYDPKEDLIYPALTPKNADSLTIKGLISRRIIASRIAEFYDPLGLFEPLKLSLKLHQAKLNGLSWDESLSVEQTSEWISKLNTLNQAASAAIPRAAVPMEGTGLLRMICLSDAAETAGGAAVYVGCKLSDGTVSCALVTAKSRLLDATVPRNELSAIMLMTELVFKTKKILEDRLDQVIYVTDSSIALAWCLNTSLKLRLFVFNRVEAIRRLIRWTIDGDKIPLYHIPGDLNLADLVTKIHKEEVTEFNSIKGGTPWQAGLPWMQKPSAELPITELHQLNIPQELSPKITEECYSEPFFIDPNQGTHRAITAFITEDSQRNKEGGTCLLATPPPGERVPFCVDMVRLGWFKAQKIVAIIAHGLHKWMNAALASTRTPIWVTESNKTKLREQADTIIFQHETRMLKRTLPAAKLAKFREQNKILYYPGRLAEDKPFQFKDLDALPFLDKTEIIAITPVVSSSSEIFFAFLMAVHLKIRPHVGNTTTLREIAKKMFVTPFPMQVVRQIRLDCTKCRLIIHKTIELEMAKHQFPRTMIAPPFYNAMVDIAFGFPGQPYKNARKRIEIYALVMVCLLTGATSIMALEGLETQDVVAALERHSARHGIPAHIFIDNGTQLKTLRRAEFSIRDLQLQVSESMGMEVSVSHAKSHEERGRVERKIKFLRASLASITENRNLPVQTAIMWETLFAKIASTIDDLPIAKGNSSNRDAWGFEILTANWIKLGRNNNRSMEGAGISVDLSPNLIKLLQRNRQIYHAWYQLFMDDIHNINLRPDKWTKSTPLPGEGDVVMFVMNDSAHSKEGRQWKLGRVSHVNKRTITIQYTQNSKQSKTPATHTVQRNPREVSVIVALDELYTNSKAYFKTINDTSQH